MEIEFNQKLEFLFKPARLKISYGGRGGGIYQILNLITDKFYIGSAINFYKRWNLHRHKLNKNTHDNKHLQAAWNKYGEQNFSFSILEICDKQSLVVKEQAWLNWTNCCDRNIGYNLAPTANSQLGVKRSQETKDKLSAYRTGIKVIFTDEHKRNLSKASKGKPKSEEHKAKVKETILLRCRDIEKWPHDLGSRCRCLECIEKKRIEQKIRRDKQNGN